MPTTNAPRKTYGRAFFRASTDTRPLQISITVAIGTSNARPNARKMPSTKLKYALMSGVIATPSGVTLAKNANITRNTMKYANAMPV